jgi:hypothetical protein
MFKKHLLDIISRNNPAKREYFSIIFEEMNLEKLLEHKLESVYLNREEKEAENFAKFNEYLPYLLEKIGEKIHGLEDEDHKKKLDLDYLFEKMSGIPKGATLKYLDNAKTVET